MRVLQTDFFGDHNVGLFAKSSDKLCVMGNNISAGGASKIHEALGAEVFSTTIANTELAGIFCALNSNGIVLPKIVTDHELNLFKEKAERKGMSVATLGSKFTAIGNLILCNDKGAVISDFLSSKDKRIIEGCLDVEADYGSVAGLQSIGSCGIATNRGCVLHRDASEQELDNIQEILKVDTDIGTANFGSPFLGSAGFASSKGVVVGESTTGPEVTRIMETLQLL